MLQIDLVKKIQLLASFWQRKLIKSQLVKKVVKHVA